MLTFSIYWKVVVFVFVNCINISQSKSLELISQCPQVLEFDQLYPDENHWFAKINIEQDEDLFGLWLKIVFDKKSIDLISHAGSIKKLNQNAYLIENTTTILYAKTQLTIPFGVSFNSNQPPSVEQILLNGKKICSATQPISLSYSPQSQFISPCPSIFQYDLNKLEEQRWFGALNIIPKSDLAGVWLRLIFDNNVINLNNTFGEIKRIENHGFLIKKGAYKATSNLPIRIYFSIEFNPNKSTAKLIEILLNGATICPENRQSATEASSQHSGVFTSPERSSTFASPTTSTIKREENIQHIPSPSSLSPSTSNLECGTIAHSSAQPLITNGRPTHNSEFPWHAALYSLSDINLKYLCGGSLVTKRHVITAAHCVTSSSSTSFSSPEFYLIYLGKFKRIPDISSLAKDVSKITVHPEYNKNTFLNDIAVLKLATDVEFTSSIRPVCLWKGENTLNSIVGKSGTVAGWGYNENGGFNDKLTKVEMPVVSTATCINSYPEFYARYSTTKTFCAGGHNNESVCSGDSGGGMVFQSGSSSLRNSNIWQLRGVVSLGVGTLSDSCDITRYVVFTDVAKFLDWIQTLLH